MTLSKNNSPDTSLKSTTPTKSAEYDSVRGSVILALESYERDKIPLEEIFARTQGLTDLSTLDVRFFRRLLSGVIKMRRRLDYQLRFFLARPADKLHSKLQNILRLGLYQLQFADRVPDAAAVDESVKLARYFFGDPKARMVNAVLRSYLREPNKTVFANPNDNPVKYLADYYSYPDYFVEYCVQEFGSEKTEKMLAEMNQPPTLTIRINLLKAKAPEIEEALKARGIGFETGAFLDEFRTLDTGAVRELKDLLDSGKIYVQDQSAGMAVRLLNPRPGLSTLDLAAAPGGKTTYAASRMRGKGRITALDKSRRRLEILMENCRRQGVKIVSPIVCDAIEFSAQELFERVIVDPPCSGWGTARRHPELRWEKTPQDIAQMIKIQSKMLEKGASLLKPGGILVYSTCTIMRAENDQIVEEFLLKHKDFILESADQFFDSSVVAERGFMKTYPAIDGLDGGFAARIKRKPN